MIFAWVTQLVVVHLRIHEVDVLTRYRSPALLIISISIFLAGCRSTTPVPIPSSVVPPSVIPAATSQTSIVTRAELLQQSLKLPKLKPGAECPRATGKQIAPAYGLAVGNGPVYAAGFGVEGILHFDQPIPMGSQFYGSTWSGNKVLWIVAPAYRGPVLVRGGRLDGPEALRFNLGLDPPSELWMDAVPNYFSDDWRAEPSFTRLQAPGCYAYQVDGQGFTEIIVFEARVKQ